MSGRDRQRSWWLAVGAACSACVRDPAPAIARPGAAVAANADGGGPGNTAGIRGASANGAGSPTGAQNSPGVRIIAAPAGDAPAVVRQIVSDARRERRDVLVYVGATWCEPCQHFHHAVEARSLDREFPNLTLIEFDLDRDAERLAAAGYVSRMIPLFAVPAADGRSTGRHMEGSIHGPEAIGEIVPRLRALIGS